MTNKEKAKDLLDRFLRDEVNAAERVLLDSWYSSFQKKISRSKIERDELEAEIFIQIAAHIYTPKKYLFPGILQYLKYAAVVLFVSALGMAAWVWNNSRLNEFTIASTQSGQTKKITLTDGSVILLWPLSKVKYPLHFHADKREVELLEGQAFFNIHHEQRRPFRVALPEGLYTHVLGTSFTISAFHHSEKIEVVVHSGKVAIGNKMEVLGMLVKGEQFTYHKNSHLTTITQVLKPIPKIRFSGSSMLDVIKEFENTFAIKISLQPRTGLEKLQFTGTFTTDQQPEKILWLLSRIHRFQFHVSADKKTFKIFK
ncbi:DUF4974 domain-containing protein [Pedobacter hiemivivus]|uniref:DUF4974 domain-containing protein n=1 Tax=Pedobacter hiemivivus TaxID=2530454 RepID=A0A4U1GLP2_9SPHI|nr:FecR family protein [Pedobacter hiemivivus]TKC65178.1 DUF4974 domain-containing protein [Pedobacter hiemivivus]